LQTLYAFSNDPDQTSNLDESQNAYNGLEIAKHIKITKGKATPIMILSGKYR
jgi:hypothetical protein